MRPPSANGWFWPVAALALLWGAAFAMACRLDAIPVQGYSSTDSVAGRFLGVSREALADSLYDQADDYFHMGVGHRQDVAFHNSLYQRWAEAIRPSLHAHTHGYTVAEIMPWLRFTTDLNPHNVEAYLTTAYWLATAIKRPDIAEQVLLEAQRNNPDDYRILSERAQAFFQKREDAKAAALLDAGIRLWPSGQDPNDEQSKLELSRMLSYRGFLYELKGGDRRQVLALLKRAQELAPANEGIARRVKALEQGIDLTEKDRELWEGVFAHKMTCAREEGAHDHADHDDDE